MIGLQSVKISFEYRFKCQIITYCCAIQRHFILEAVYVQGCLRKAKIIQLKQDNWVFEVLYWISAVIFPATHNSLLSAQMEDGARGGRERQRYALTA